MDRSVAVESLTDRPRSAIGVSGEGVPHRPGRPRHVRPLQRAGVDEVDPSPQGVLAVAGPGDLRHDPAVGGPAEERRVGQGAGPPVAAADGAVGPRTVGRSNAQVAAGADLFALVRDEAAVWGKHAGDPRKRPVPRELRDFRCSLAAYQTLEPHVRIRIDPAAEAHWRPRGAEEVRGGPACTGAHAARGQPPRPPGAQIEELPPRLDERAGDEGQAEVATDENVAAAHDGEAPKRHRSRRKRPRMAIADAPVAAGGHHANEHRDGEAHAPILYLRGP